MTFITEFDPTLVVYVSSGTFSELCRFGHGWWGHVPINVVGVQRVFRGLGADLVPKIKVTC